MSELINEFGELDYGVVKRQALIDVFGVADSSLVHQSRYKIAMQTAQSVVDQLVGKVVSISVANRVLEEERENIADIVAERDRYRVALERVDAMLDVDDELDGLVEIRVRQLVKKTLETTTEVPQ